MALNVSNLNSCGVQWSVIAGVGFSLAVATWAIHQEACQERFSSVSEEKIQTVRLLINEGGCLFLKGNKDSQSSNELHLTVGEQVEFHLESQDYVYGLRQSDFDLNSVAVPGVDSIIQINTSIPGTFLVELSPMCGILWKHNESPGIIIVEERRRDKCE